MKIAWRHLGISLVVGILAGCGAVFAQNQPEIQEIPSISGDAGGCSATFTVRDGSGKPIYDAKIRVKIRYGVMSLHRTDLEASTNSDGKVRFTGLPNFPKKPLEFEVERGAASKEVTDDPASTCIAHFNVSLAAQ